MRDKWVSLFCIVILFMVSCQSPIAEWDRLLPDKPIFMAYDYATERLWFSNPTLDQLIIYELI